MNTIQDPESKIKMLEMHVARLERELENALNEIDDIKKYILKIITHQSALSEKIKLWPFVVVNKTTGGDGQ